MEDGDESAKTEAALGLRHNKRPALGLTARTEDIQEIVSILQNK